jgi:curved DNA-binding protein CbpA
MGNAGSTQTFDPVHLRIYKNILSLQSPGTRVQMIQTLLAGPEYVNSMKRGGVYPALLAYISAVQRGERPPLLPGERTGILVPEAAPTNTSQRDTTTNQAMMRGGGGTIVKRDGVPTDPYKMVAKTGSNEKAMSYFSSCLRVLGLQEEVALTEEALKGAYKKAATRAHPDKGGSEEAFEAVTRAYAYLSDILKRIRGGRTKESVVEAPEKLTSGRKEDAKAWEQVEPVRLNAKNLNMDAFNKMFEQTRMPDPEDEGYGDWLKDSAGADSGPKFSGKFNRDVFHKMFEDEVKKSNRGRGDNVNGHQLAVMNTQAITLAPTMGVEIGRDRPADFTSPYNANFQYTDLRNAYTRDSTFSAEVADVRVENRTFDQYSTERKSAPRALANHEMEAVQAAERAAEERERQRKLRAAQQDNMAEQYFERMKRLVITEK